MVKQACREGCHWDLLLQVCIDETNRKCDPPKVPFEPPQAPVDQVSAMTPTTIKVYPVMVPSLAEWIFVAVFILGSVLVLALWFIICRRHSRVSSTSDDTEPLANFSPPLSERNGQMEMFQRVAEAPTPCHHLHPGAQTVSKREEGFVACRGPSKHAGAEVGSEPSACNTMAAHRIPLPATELGGTALVTTKTV